MTSWSCLLSIWIMAAAYIQEILTLSMLPSLAFLQACVGFFQSQSWGYYVFCELQKSY